MAGGARGACAVAGVGHGGPGRQAAGGAGVDVLEALGRCGGLLHGHFILSSGRHADTYLQLAAPFEHPQLAEGLALTLAAVVRDAGLQPATVVGPAYGAILPGYELARALGSRFLFTERGADGKMALRRGFALEAAEPVLVCENTLTTGGSALEALAVVRAQGATPVGVAVYCDRVPDPAAVFGALPYVAAARIPLASWPAEACPLCRAGSLAVKPGSRPQPR